jgi:hypothetical protein
VRGTGSEPSHLRCQRARYRAALRREGLQTRRALRLTRARRRRQPRLRLGDTVLVPLRRACAVREGSHHQRGLRHIPGAEPSLVVSSEHHNRGLHHKGGLRHTVEHSPLSHTARATPASGGGRPRPAPPAGRRRTAAGRSPPRPAHPPPSPPHRPPPSVRSHRRVTFCTTVHLLYTRFAMRIAPSVSERRRFPNPFDLRGALPLNVGAGRGRERRFEPGHGWRSHPHAPLHILSVDPHTKQTGSGRKNDCATHSYSCRAASAAAAAPRAASAAGSTLTGDNASHAPRTSLYISLVILYSDYIEGRESNLTARGLVHLLLLRPREGPQLRRVHLAPKRRQSHHHARLLLFTIENR